MRVVMMIDDGSTHGAGQGSKQTWGRPTAVDSQGTQV